MSEICAAAGLTVDFLANVEVDGVLESFLLVGLGRLII